MAAARLAARAPGPEAGSSTVHDVDSRGGHARRSLRRPWAWLAVLTSPAAVWVVLAGQNTFLSLALLYGGMRLLDRSPANRGRPPGSAELQAADMDPGSAGLVAARQWRALAWMVAAVSRSRGGERGDLRARSLARLSPASHDAATPQAANEMFEQMYMHMTNLLPLRA